MNHSGDAAEQIVRMSLEGVEVATRITGTAAKEIAVLIIAALKNKNSSLKLKGKARLTSMLKSGKALEIFSVKERDLTKFVQGAKEYGIVYCVLRNTKNSPDGLCDIMVKADDAPKISRLVERFKFATVDKAKIESEIAAAKTEKAAVAKAEETADLGAKTPNINDTEKLLDELLGTDTGKAAPEKPSAKETPEKANPRKDNPFFQKGRKTLPSEPISENRSKSAKGTFHKESVREELREISAELKNKETSMLEQDEPLAAHKETNPAITHKRLFKKAKLKPQKKKRIWRGSR